MTWLNNPQLLKTILDVGVVLVTVLLMLTVGMELDGRHFREVARRKWIVGLLLGSQVVLLPLLGLAVAHVWAMPPHVQAGILLVAACPVGDIANFYALIARGDTALSLTLNTLSCLLCAATMAIVFAAYDQLLPQQLVLAVPTPRLVTRLVLMLLVPVLAGMAVRRFWPGVASSSRQTLRNSSFIGVGFLIAYVLLVRRAQLSADWIETLLAATLFMAAAFGVGSIVARALRLDAAERFTTGMVFATRNVGLATAIAITLLGQLEYAVFAAMYFLAEVPLLLGACAVHRCWRVNASSKAPAAAELQL